MAAGTTGIAIREPERLNPYREINENLARHILRRLPD
jgi:hypothetical protein